MELDVDPKRVGMYGNTGIFVRARSDGKWGNHDITELTSESLLAWLQSRGGDNPWAESVVLLLLGHDR
jgi:hypothetical protein